ncbi:Gfo/Idh/MocA family protein [Dongia deserti]|uniref:Gfo/Idh/MocA family protein n=1 Tax=Dongia deserti TaxID=2268030 RepID=UPI000E64BF23|nr:Gfo/Idh/MocA family oxidoreductase [Dongia deserti]
MPQSIGIGVVGTGIMGAAHAMAFRSAPTIFETALSTRLEVVADVSLSAAQQAAQRFGFRRAVESWQELIADPAVDIVSITTPNALHHDIAIAALKAGKHVYCEKPLAANLAAAEEMAAVARSAKGKTLVGYNYIRSPAIAFAKQLIAEGAIGNVSYFRGVCDEDYMADEETPYSWRCRQDMAGLGALGDLASHLVSIAHDLIGPVRRLVADTRILIPKRPVPAAGDGTERRDMKVALSGEYRAVENEDTAHALLQFDGGIMGTLVTSRAHWGRKSHLAFEVFGSNGSILFDHERMNELQIYTKDASDAPTNGYRLIPMGPEHPFYGRFSPAKGHGIGFNDLKIIEVAHLLEGIAGKETLSPTIGDALAIEKVLHSVIASAKSGSWVELA